MSQEPVDPGKTPPVVCDFTLSGMGAQGGLRAEQSYSFHVRVLFETHTVVVDMPRTHTNHFDDYGSPTYPEQDKAAEVALKSAGVETRSPWPATLEFPVDQLSRAVHALRALLVAPEQGRLRETLAGFANNRTSVAEYLIVWFFHPDEENPTWTLGTLENPFTLDTLRDLIDSLPTQPARIDGRLEWELPAQEGRAARDAFARKVNAVIRG